MRTDMPDFGGFQHGKAAVIVALTVIWLGWAALVIATLTPVREAICAETPTPAVELCK